MGFALGIFQAGLWLDQNWKGKTEFEERFLKVILQEIVTFAKAPALDFADALPTDRGEPRIDYYRRILPAYQGKLANAVKRFFRPDQLDAVGVMQFIAQQERVYDPSAPSAGSRLALAFDFMDWSVNRLPVKTTKLGEILAGQIAYAVAGSISGIAVLEAIHWRLSKILQPPAKAAETPKKVRIVSMPPGKAPDWALGELMGLELPIVPGPACLGEGVEGYVVDGAAVLNLLREKPSLCDRPMHCLSDLAKVLLVLPKDVCEVIDDSQPTQPEQTPDQPRAVSA